MIITKLPKRWIEENEVNKYYFINDNNKIYYHTYNKELNEFISKNRKSYYSIKEYLECINDPNKYPWYKTKRPFIIKALKEEEFNNLIKEL